MLLFDLQATVAIFSIPVVADKGLCLSISIRILIYGIFLLGTSIFSPSNSP